MVFANMQKLTMISNCLKRPIAQVIVDATESYASAILPLLEGKTLPLDKQEREQIAQGELIWQDSDMAKSAQSPESSLSQVQLIKTIQELREEVRVLRQAIDEFRETYQHAMLNQDNQIETLAPFNPEPTPLPEIQVAIIEFQAKKKAPQSGTLRIAEETTSGRQLDLF